MTDQEKIQKLEQENNQLKEHLKEGREVFGNMDEMLGISKAIDSGFFMAKVGSIIMSVQRNPEMLEKVTAYLQKINQLDLD